MPAALGRPGMCSLSDATECETSKIGEGLTSDYKKTFEHDKAYIFQNSDGRILFAIPYLGDFTLVGTTDVDHPDHQIARR